MNSGLSFVLCLAFVSLGGSILIVRAVRRLDELEVMEERRRGWARLDLPPSAPPPCLRELDPNGPFDWQQMGEQ